MKNRYTMDFNRIARQEKMSSFRNNEKFREIRFFCVIFFIFEIPMIHITKISCGLFVNRVFHRSGTIRGDAG